mgnify:CR=1 FL=1|jgi:hypothetical protein
MGSDMTNMLWAPANAAIVMLAHPGASTTDFTLPGDWNVAFFRDVAKLLGLRFQVHFLANFCSISLDFSSAFGDFWPKFAGGGGDPGGVRC